MSEVCAMFSPDCHGRLEWHHAIKQQRLRREFKYGAIKVWAGARRWRPADRYQVEDLLLDDILGDTRNRIFLCSLHHERLTNARLEIALPDSVWEFAREFGLEAALENDLARRSAA